jgi:pyrroline-5-carboxylate reductase
MLTRKKIAVIGTGKLGEILIKALLEAKVIHQEQIMGADKDVFTAERKAQAHGYRSTTDNAAAARWADVIIVAVRPQSMAEALGSIRKAVHRDKLVISTAASVSTTYIERHLQSGVPVVRAMPNTPCMLRAGMTGICPGKSAKKEHLSLAEAIFSAIGRVVVLDEKHMDAVTGLSGSGPAFMYVVLESMTEGGVAVGLPRDVATELAAQTMLGAARMVLETREHPAKLKDVVTTPAGCTIDGLMELETGGLRVTLIKTVVRAAKRASELLHG